MHRWPIVHDTRLLRTISATDIVAAMTKKISLDGGIAARTSGSVYFILSSLADGEKHGYALTKDIEHFAGVRLAPGTLYEALARLESQGLIEAVASQDRRRPYRLSASGAEVLDVYIKEQERFVRESRARLRRNWRLA
jgi:DNA-binding PadR family transcriptional regulator